MFHFKTKYIVTFATFILFVVALCAQGTNEGMIGVGVGNSNKVYVVRGDRNFPPFEFINDKGEPDGFDVEIFKAVMQELNLKYDLKLNNFPDVYSGIMNDSIDIAIGMIYNTDRTRIMDFSIPHNLLRYSAVTINGNKYIHLKQLLNKKIVVVKLMKPYEYLLQQGFKKKNIIVVNQPNEAIEMITSQKADVIFCYDKVAYYYINKLSKANLSISYLQDTPSLQLAMTVPKNDSELVYMLNIGLHNLKLNGKYDEIYNKWFGIATDRFQLSETGYYILYTVGGLLLIAFLFILLLRYRINQTTKDLRHSNKEMSLAFKAGELTLWLMNEDRLLTIIKDDKNIYKYQWEQFLETVHPDYRENLIAHLNSLFRGVQKLDKMVIKIKNPEIKQYVYIEYYVIVDQYKYDDTKRLIGTYKDITSKQLLDEKLKEYRVRTDLIMKGSLMRQWYYDIAEDTVYFYNDHQFGSNVLSEDKIINALHPDDKEKYLSLLQTMREGNDKHLTVEYRVFMKSYNSYRTMVSNCMPYERDKEGRIMRYIGLTRDNTEWTLMMQKMVDLKEKAETANKLKSAFLANMSHEIRTPLNSIVGFSDLITSTDDADEKQEYSKLIHMNNELLLKLVNDVLDLSKLEAGSFKMERASFDIGAYFDDLYSNFLPKMKEGVKLICEKQYDAYTVYLDPERVTQVITNFITNAIKFTHKGSITMGYLIEGNRIKLYVKDTGIGISKENQQRVFERFEKINSFSQGTGLGLSICKNLVECNGGQIGVDSIEGEGSTFWAWLVLHSKDEIENKLDSQPNDSLQSIENETKSVAEVYDEQKQKKAVRKRKLILVAEDDESNYLFMESLLSKKYELVRAINGRDAIKECKRVYPDLVFMDVKMPEMDGLTATKNIRQFDKKVPIIASTAYAYDSDKERALAAGCNNYISKPIDTKRMFELIEAYIK